MARVFTSPEKPSNLDRAVFLAGSIDQNSALDWQSEVIAKMQDDDCTILNPRRTQWDRYCLQDETNPEFVGQVEWELDALTAAQVIMMYFDPKGMAPVTLLELGLFAHSGKLIVCCPEGYWRRGNVQVVCSRYDIETASTLDDLVRQARFRLT